MKVLILGDGLLGSELHRQTGWDMVSRKRETLDIDNPEGLGKLIKNYDTVINCIINLYLNIFHFYKFNYRDLKLQQSPVVL